MKNFYLLFFVTITLYGQDPIYSDAFDTGGLYAGNEPSGFQFEIADDAWRITGTSEGEPWTALSYNLHNNGTSIVVDAATSPKLYIKAKATNTPELRIDLQDVDGFMTNYNPSSITLTDTYTIYELNYTNRLEDGAYGGPCETAPCPVDPSKLSGLLLFINPGVGGYTGTIDIDWISLGQSLEEPTTPTYEIRYNQVAYLTSRTKYINLAGAAEFTPVPYEVLNASDEVVLSGTSSTSEYWDDSREFVSQIDVTALEINGTYKLITPDTEISFTVADTYNDLPEAALKYYYYNRASTAIPAQYGGEFQRPSGHPDDQVKIHSSAASASRPEGTIIAAPKGWYDAGDYNKYIVNSGISTYTLLAAYEHYTSYYDNFSLNIPEQGGDLPDLLDEILWNIEWMLDMQDPNDGGVYHKLTGLNFSGEVMPHEYNLDRYVVQKTTAASLNFAAVMAVASRIFSDFESVKPGFSQELLTAARQAYTWAQNNPEIYYNQPSDVYTGAYGDGYVGDEFQWAATELFITTQEDAFLNAMNLNQITNGIPTWNSTAPLALISLAYHKNMVENELNFSTVENKLLQTANALTNTLQNSPMQTAMGNDNDFTWGSNGQAGNQLMILLRAYDLTQNPDYLDAAYIGVDYLLGRNATGYSFITGYGDKKSLNPHHRISKSDAITQPVPGMVVGGPNPGQQDNCTGYPNNYPATSYSDTWCSYASNEVTINWNAPFAYSINALEYYQQEENALSVADQAESINTIWKIYPNPVQDTLYVNPDFTQKSYLIYDLNGKKIQKGIIEETGINVNSIKQGVYFLQIDKKTIKFIKK